MAGCKGMVKLFGKTIPVPAEGVVAVAVGAAEESGGGGGGGFGGEEGSKSLPDRSPDQESASSQEQGEQQVSSPTGCENEKGSSPPTVDREPPSEKNSMAAEDQDTASDPPEKTTIKKPDKILPCPRCNSMDTKFCYYNNYNVNQPRHFCKNCQRYWTAGGTMRNVPVGAGRRKNKHSASHYRHIAVAKAGLQQYCRPDIAEVVHRTELKPNETVLSFASDVPLCESMASVLNLVEKHAAPFSCTSGGGAEAADEHSSGSSVTASNSAADAASQNRQAYPTPQVVSCYGGAPWPYSWPAALPVCASSFPIPVYPMTPYWGCTAVPGGAWSVPWLAPPSSSPASSGSAAGTGPSSPTQLGKHSRDGEKRDGPEQDNGERCLWIPKTLRINDPEEAARSSIWATMGFKNEKTDGVSRAGFFGDFNLQPKAEISNRGFEPSSQVLHANPAALSRSLNFHERL